jgi:uncharacterized protein
MEMSRKNYALITGGTSGIGFELAKLFTKDGYNLVLAARMEEGLENAANELKKLNNIDIKTVTVDLEKPNSVEEVLDKIKGEGVVIDVLVNNAGQGELGKFHEVDYQRHLNILHLNVTAVVAFTHYLLKDMTARNSGKILFLGSTYGKAPAPLMTMYSATKHFVHSFGFGIMNELKDTNIGVTILIPGPTDTDFFHKSGMEETTVYKEEDLADPAKVAKDGYDALMSGKSSVISGLKNKMTGTMSDLLPDPVSASMNRKYNEKSDVPANEGKVDPDHKKSKEEKMRGERKRKV